MNFSDLHSGIGDQASLTALAQRLERSFVIRHARKPTCVVAAPGRVNLIGEHIDYNDGFVLPMAIERYVAIAAARREDDAPPSASFYSVNLRANVQIAWHVPLQPAPPHWSNYLAGVVAGFIERGVPIPAFDAVIESTVPLGGGLSSSAALEVAIATLLEAFTGAILEPVDKALLCQQAEHRFAGVPCGIMDQFTSVLGQEGALMLLDCQRQEALTVPFVADDITVLIANSNVHHELTGGEYAERRAQCDSARKKLGLASWRDATLDQLTTRQDELADVEFRRARHVITEIARATDAAQSIRRQQWEHLGQLMYASHESLRNDYEVSCSELDLLVDLAREIGARGGMIGSRMTGGGFGGCTVSVVRSELAASIAETLATRYTERTGIAPHVFASRPARGAHVVRQSR